MFGDFAPKTVQNFVALTSRLKMAGYVCWFDFCKADDWLLCHISVIFGITAYNVSA